MKQHWHMDPLPPAETSSRGPDGFASFALLAFVVVGAMIYFESELHAAERLFVTIYGTIEAWLLPLHDGSGGR